MESVTSNREEFGKCMDSVGNLTGYLAAEARKRMTGKGNTEGNATTNFPLGAGRAIAVNRRAALTNTTFGGSVNADTKEDVFERCKGGGAAWRRDFEVQSDIEEQTGRPASPLCGGIGLCSSTLKHRTGTGTDDAANAPLGIRSCLVLSSSHHFPVKFLGRLYPPSLAKLGKLTAQAKTRNPVEFQRAKEQQREDVSKMVEVKTAEVELAYPSKGDRYVGEVWTNLRGKNVPHGVGRCELHRGRLCGNVYVGEWEKGIKNGKGTMVYRYGNKFEGHYKNDRPSGYGIFTWSDGSKYEGNFANGKIKGRGVLTDAGGNRYEGDWESNKLMQGTWTGVDGEKYVGSFLDGKMAGKGVLTDREGNKYEGDFENGEIVHGTWTGINGETYRGDFYKGKMEGKGIFTWPDGKTYEGDWKNDLPNGKGAFSMKVYIGDVKDGMMEGEGELVLTNEKYVGKFANDAPTGEGVKTDKAGNIIPP